MLMIKPGGRSLTEEQAKALDDQFFLADPLAFFSSKIRMLLEANHSASEPAEDAVAPFYKVLRNPGNDDLLKYAPVDRHLQVAVDAVALRHHAAESLIRLLFALTAATARDGDAPCVWLAVSDSPKMTDVLARMAATLNADEGLLAGLYFPPGVELDEEASGAFDTALSWVNHAIHLLSGHELAVNAGHNKVKHGLAVSVRGDVRVEFIHTPVGDPSRVPVTAFGPGKSTPIFDRPVLTFVSRGNGAPKMGLEAVTLRVDVPTVLAETWMMANVYAAVFNVAARAHFDGDGSPNIADYPPLPIGPSPEQMLAGKVLGTRSTITSPPDGVTPPRRGGIFEYGRFTPITIDYDRKIEGLVVDG
jgi:hypothetical protein